MKIATRYLLPLEMLMSIVMLSWGISGWLGGGVLWRTLEEVDQGTEWGVALCVVGALHFAVTMLEWFAGRRWADRRVLHSVTARQVSGFLSFAVWLYACFLIATLPGAWHIFALVIQAPACMVASVWIFVENCKAACVLNPDFPTEQLQRRILLERIKQR